MKILTSVPSRIASFACASALLTQPSLAKAGQSQASLQATLVVSGGCAFLGRSGINFGTVGAGTVSLPPVKSQLTASCAAGLAPTFAVSDGHAVPGNPNQFTMLPRSKSNTSSFPFVLQAENVDTTFVDIANDATRRYTFGITAGTNPVNTTIIPIEAALLGGSSGEPDSYFDLITITVNF